MKKIILTIFVLSLQIIGTNLFAEKITLKPSQPLSVKINNEDSIKLYSNLSAFKGIEVYVWKNSKNEPYFGFLEGTNRNKTEKDYNLLYENPVDFETAKKILKNYKDDTFITVTKLGDDLPKEQIKNVKAGFDELKMKNLKCFLDF